MGVGIFAQLFPLLNFIHTSLFLQKRKNQFMTRRLFQILGFLSLFGSFCFGQTTPPHYAHIPSLTGVNNVFFNAGFCTKFQFIYTQAEMAGMISPITGPLNINRIWFRHGGGSSDLSAVISGLVIKMGHTTLNNPTNQFSANFNQGAPVTVLSAGTYTYTPLIGNENIAADNWTYIDLQTPFAYNFSDNLCVEISFSNSSGFIVGNFADNGGTPITQFTASNISDQADASTSRPVFGISATVPCSIQIQTQIQSQVSCPGGDDGSATVIGTGGSGSLTYTWMPGNLSGAAQANLTVGTYLVEVSDGPGCNDSVTLTITEPPPILLSETITPSNCGSSDGAINVTASGGTSPYSYLWSPGDITTNPATDLSAGIYSLTVTDQAGCTAAGTYSVPQNNPLNLQISPSFANIPAGESVLLTASGADFYTWSPTSGLSCSDCPNPEATPASSTTYSVIGSNAEGCTDSAFVTITVQENATWFIPNTFTPDEDAVNPVFFPITLNPSTVDYYQMRIYDRWGQLIFSSKTMEDGWDGTYRGNLQQNGIYAWLLEFNKINSDKTEVLSGHVLLLR